MKKFKDFLKEETKNITFVFGRFNPPTIGHEKLFEKLKSVAGNSPYRIYASQSNDPKKNPLDFDTKVKYLRKMFPRHARNIMSDSNVKTVFDIATKVFDQGYNSVTMVVGSDRLTEFETLLNKYNGVKGRHGFYQFANISIVSAGERDPDAEDVSGMSASKLRAAAAANDFALFSKGVPSSFKETKQLFNDIRKGMGLSESVVKNHIKLEPVSEEREAYVAGELYNIGDEVIIVESNEIATITYLGANYIIVENSDGKKSRKWLSDVELIEKLEKDSDDPCWKGYAQLGMKKKNGKEIPNCVPVEEKDLEEISQEKLKKYLNKAHTDHIQKSMSSDELWMASRQNDGPVSKRLKQRSDELNTQAKKRLAGIVKATGKLK